MDESCACEPASVRLSLQVVRLSYFKNSDFTLIAEKYNESVANRSYFTNKSCHAVCALRNRCVQ